MSRKHRMDHALSDALKPDVLIIENESYKHRVPEGSESHFKIILVAKQFDGLNRVARHRMINSLLDSEFEAGLHALSLSLYTPEEWEERGGKAQASPPCQHRKD